MNRCRISGLSMIEIMIGLAAVSILAMMLLPALVDSDLPARKATSLHNLQTIRNAIQLFRLKEKRSPDSSLSELLTETYCVLEKKHYYLSSMPSECISDSAGLNSITNTLNTSGGWYYDPENGIVSINYNRELGAEWDIRDGRERNPSKW